MLLFFYFILATEASIVTTSVSEKVSSNKAHVQVGNSNCMEMELEY